MIQIVLSPKASQTMDNYFENYIGTQNKNDMNQRAHHYSRILKCLSQINHMDTYIVNEKNFVDIDDICRLEFEITNNDTQIVVMEIYFNNNRGINEDMKPVLDFMKSLLEVKFSINKSQTIKN